MVDWLAVKAFDEALKSSPELVQQAFETMLQRWNELLFELASIVKDNGRYEGETDEELLKILQEKAANFW